MIFLHGGFNIDFWGRDSGGPIHSGMTVIGLSTASKTLKFQFYKEMVILTQFISIHVAAVCAREESPGVYTKLSHYYYWLETRIK